MRTAIEFGKEGRCGWKMVPELCHAEPSPASRLHVSSSVAVIECVSPPESDRLKLGSLTLGVRSKANDCPRQPLVVTTEKASPRVWPLWFKHLQPVSKSTRGSGGSGYCRWSRKDVQMGQQCQEPGGWSDAKGPLSAMAFVLPRKYSSLWAAADVNVVCLAVPRPLVVSTDSLNPNISPQ